MEIEIQQIFVTNGRDWLGLIVECAVPVIIMIITLIVSRIQQNRALRQQAKESKQQLEQQAKEHAQEMLVQKDVLRLSIMPVFDVVSITGEYDSPGYLKNSPKKNHILKIVLKNVGSGNALGLVTLLSPCNDDIVFGLTEATPQYIGATKILNTITLLQQSEKRFPCISLEIKEAYQFQQKTSSVYLFDSWI